RVREDRDHVPREVGRQVGAREPCGRIELATVDPDGRVGLDLGPVAMDRVSAVVHRPSDLADLDPVWPAEAEFLVHLAAGGLEWRLSPPVRAPPGGPAGAPLGLAHGETT